MSKKNEKRNPISGPYLIGPYGAKVAIVKIGTRLARELLEGTTAKNRKTQREYMKFIEREMSTNAFVLGPDAIVLDKEGNVRNGAHRLKNVIKVGKPQWFIVLYDYPAEYVHKFDHGKRRTAADSFYMEEMDHASVYAKAAQMLLCWDEGDLKLRSMRKTSGIEVLKYAEEHPEVLESVEFVLGRDEVLSDAQAAFIHCVLSRVNKSQANGFMDKLLEGANLRKTSLVFKLRQKLLKTRRRKGEKLDPAYERLYTFAVWNMIRKGKRLGKRNFDDMLPDISGTYPVPE